VAVSGVGVSKQAYYKRIKAFKEKQMKCEVILQKWLKSAREYLKQAPRSSF